MTIAPAIAPDVIAQRAMAEASAARDLRRPPGMDRVLMDAGSGDRVEAAAADPLPIYTIAIETLANELPSQIADASHQGWRVRTVDAQGEQLVDLGETGEPLAVRRGQSTEILKRSVALAEQVVEPDVAYEARLLDFGQLGLSALWLYQEHGADRFFSLDREPHELKEDDLLADASARARRYVAKSDRGAGDSAPTDVGG